MRRLSQRDPRWSEVMIGSSRSTLGLYGCLITALCMIYSKFHPFGPKINPDAAAKDWSYSVDLVDWRTNYVGMSFVERVHTYVPTRDDAQIKKYCQSEDYGVVLQVQTGSGLHWVAAVGKSTLGWATNDPWNGRRLWKTVGFGASYKRVLGWAVMKKESL